MSGKIAVIDGEFNRVTSELKKSHQESIEVFRNLIELTKQLSSDALNTEQLSPKLEGLVDGVDTDVVSKVTELFTKTEEVIKDFETAIVNIDTSCK